MEHLILTINKHSYVFIESLMRPVLQKEEYIIDITGNDFKINFDKNIDENQEVIICIGKKKIKGHIINMTAKRVL